MSLVEQTGFEGFDAGTITDSWRQQPGSPVYCTDRTAGEMTGALGKATVERSPERRDLAMHVIADLMGTPPASSARTSWSASTVSSTCSTQPHCDRAATARWFVRRLLSVEVVVFRRATDTFRSGTGARSVCGPCPRFR
jgi:hypothetical protein